MPKELRIFIGWEPRQAEAAELLAWSVCCFSSIPVQITYLCLDDLGPLIGRRKGASEFSFSRFLVPFLCDYKGWALFLDADMLCKGDVAELAALIDDEFSLKVVKQGEDRYQWAGIMLMNCSELACWSPENVSSKSYKWLYRFEPILDGKIGVLPGDWNVLDGVRPGTKLIHWTSGGPWNPGYAKVPAASVWFAAFLKANGRHHENDPKGSAKPS